MELFPLVRGMERWGVERKVQPFSRGLVSTKAKGQALGHLGPPAALPPMVSTSWMADPSMFLMLILRAWSPNHCVCVYIYFRYLHIYFILYFRYLKKEDHSNSQVVQWLVLHAFTAVLRVQSPVRELRFCKLRGTAEKKKTMDYLKRLPLVVFTHFMSLKNNTEQAYPLQQLNVENVCLWVFRHHLWKGRGCY